MVHFLSRRDARRWLEEQAQVIDLDLFSLVEDKGRMFMISNDLRKVDFFNDLRVVRFGFQLLK